MHLVIGYFKIATHACILISLCIRIAAAAEEVVYEVVVEPQEPQGKPHSRRIVGSRPKAPLTPVLSSRRKASPGAHSFISNYDTYIYVAITCALGLGIVGTLVA